MAGKRKRSDVVTEGGGREVNGDRSVQHLDQFHHWLVDALVILRVQDTSPSAFDLPIISAAQSHHDSKRAKLSQTSETTTIGTLVGTRAYTAVEEVVKDLETATAHITNELEEAADGDQGRHIPREAQAGISRTAALMKEFDRLIQREMIQGPRTIVSSGQIKDQPSEEEETKFVMKSSNDDVLTLLASTQPPKQLFTSLRKSGSKASLNEHALPNGITTTTITPQHSINEDGNKPAPTLKDLFAPPPSLPSLAVPKQSRHTSTRSSSVNWYNPTETDSKSGPSRRGAYVDQELSSGQWLKYSVAPSPTQLASPETKRKQRDRALSIGEPQTSLSQEAIETHNQAKEDALFRSVYSSFAPDHDDSGALIAEQEKDRLWWRKYGETKYHELLETRDEASGRSELLATDGVSDSDKLDEDELEVAIANWKPQEATQEMQESNVAKAGPPGNTEEADELLEEISDLLETLHSHQRIRNLTLATNARPSTGQNTQSTSTAGSPTSPSSLEFDVYDTLKNQLALIVSTLPPYLLSKLDGNKIGALKISANLQVESKNQKGTLEESEASAIARRAAAPIVAPASTTQTPSAYPNVPGRSNSYLQASTPVPQYPRTGYGASMAPRASTSSSYLQNPQYSNRPASSNYSSTSARPSYPTGYPSQGAAATAPRYNYAQQYGQQQAHSSYGSYQNGYRPYSGQNANSYNYNSQGPAPQNRKPAKPAQASPQPYRGTPAEYQQRAVPPQGYGYGSAKGGGSASPHAQHRPHGSGPATQGSAHQRPQLYHQSSSQNLIQTPGSPQVNGTAASGSPVSQGHLSADEQAALMNKQKAQLAERQSRPGSSTPQPGSRQFTPQQDGAQPKGTPAPQTNGITVG